VNFTFIEKQRDRAEHLKKVLASRFPPDTLRNGWSYSVDQGEFETVFNGAIDDIEKRGNRLAPTFAFLDPFGFTGFPMKSIRRLLAFEKCEVLVTFMDGFAKRFLDELRAEALDDLFGSPDWRSAQALQGEERTGLLVELYDRQLRSQAGAKFVRSFEMRDANNRVIYHLFFATRHPEGLRQMKEAMWTVDRRGMYRFSDVTGARQRFLLDYLVDDTPEWVDAAGRMVYERFHGQEVPAPQVKDPNFPRS
jgi:three-Cys-motif partner protein